VDDGTQTKAFLEAGLWDGLLWLAAALAAALAGLAKRTWTRHEKRIDEIEEMCMKQHTSRQHDLNQHAAADSRSHDDIRKELATELKLVYAKIDSSNSAGEARADALSSQMTTQHGQITARVDKILELMIEGGK
jgi:hypothetical protein